MHFNWQYVMLIEVSAVLSLLTKFRQVSSCCYDPR